MSAPLKDIGALNRRLVLEAPVETGDGAGGVVRTYEAVATLWAQVMPVSARDDIAADSLGAVLRHRIVIRARGRHQHAASLARRRTRLPDRCRARKRRPALSRDRCEERED